MKKTVLLALFSSGLAAAAVGAEDARVPSQVYEWADLEVEQSETRERRHVFKGSTETLEYLQVHSSTVEPGMAAHDAHTHLDREEIIIIKEGTMEHTLNGESRILPAGSVTLALPGVSHGMRNVGDTPAIYYIIRWRTREPLPTPNPEAKSFSVNWDELEVKYSFKGARRNLFRHPTTMLAEFEMHVTTLKEGMKSHDPHTHVEDEIILVRSGRVEELIDGKAQEAGPGSVIFLGSNIPHGIRNIGEGPCEYYAFKWFLPAKASSDSK